MDVFSNLMVIGECLLDVRRTNAFIRSIRQVVKNGDIVLDVGTGSGILAMTAARAGAKRVYAIDIAEDIVTFARHNIKTNNLESLVSVEHTDAKQFSAKEPVDVITMELMDTWLVGEQQGVVINNLHDTGTISETTKLIPYRYQCALTLVSYDFSFYGNEMPFVIQARNFDVLQRVQARLSPRIIANDVDFRQRVKTDVTLEVPVEIGTSGRCNAVLLESRTFLAPGITVWGTTDMNMPVVVPIHTRDLKEGEKVLISIKYAMGEGFEKFNVKW